MRKDLLTDTMQPKKELVRIVIDKEKNVSVDPTGKKAGRGAYVRSQMQRERGGFTAFRSGAHRDNRQALRT